MAIVVTGNYSKWKLGKTLPLTAYREWTVTGVSTETLALAAIDATDPTMKIAQRGDGHDFAPTRLFCTGPFVVQRSKGGHVWTIGANFTEPTTGTIDPVPDDLLLKPTRIRWNQVTVCEQVDTDLDGRPIVGPTGDLIEGVTREATYYELTLTRHFPSWNVSLNAAYVNACNSVAVTAAGVSIGIQHMRCTGFAPTSEYIATTPRLEMCAKFDVYFDDSLGIYPFQSRVMAQGVHGFTATSKDYFCSPTGTPVSSPIKLDANGTPLNLDGNGFLKVRNAVGALVAPTVATAGTGWLSIASPTGSGTGGAVLDYQTLSFATVGYFKRTRVVNLLGFLSLF